MQRPHERVDSFEQLDALVQQLQAEEDLCVCEDVICGVWEVHNVRVQGESLTAKGGPQSDSVHGVWMRGFGAIV